MFVGKTAGVGEMSLVEDLVGYLSEFYRSHARMVMVIDVYARYAEDSKVVVHARRLFWNASKRGHSSVLKAAFWNLKRTVVVNLG